VSRITEKSNIRIQSGSIPKRVGARPAAPVRFAVKELAFGISGDQPPERRTPFLVQCVHHLRLERYRRRFPRAWSPLAETRQASAALARRILWHDPEGAKHRGLFGVPSEQFDQPDRRASNNSPKNEA
jgi:hypothetical protein